MNNRLILGLFFLFTSCLDEKIRASCEDIVLIDQQLPKACSIKKYGDKLLEIVTVSSNQKKNLIMLRINDHNKLSLLRKTTISFENDPILGNLSDNSLNSQNNFPRLDSILRVLNKYALAGFSRFYEPSGIDLVLFINNQQILYYVKNINKVNDPIIMKELKDSKSVSSNCYLFTHGE